MNGDMGIDHLDALTNRIIHCVITVHQTLGPGFLELLYRRALVIELRKRRLRVEVEKPILVHYDGCEVGGHRLDLVVERSVLLELKTVEQLGKAHYAQVRSYLRATGLPLALLINFATERADFRRVWNRERSKDRPRVVERERNSDGVTPSAEKAPESV